MKHLLLLSVILLSSCSRLPYEAIFISNREGALDIYYRDKNGGISNLSNSPLVEYGMSWSPDGNRILYAAQVGKQYDLFIRDFDSGATARLTKDEVDQFGPNFSSDGRHIAYVSKKDHSLGEIVVMDLEEKSEKRITDNDKMDSSPAFFPDGSTLLYSSFLEKDSSGNITNSEIFLTDMAGARHKQILAQKGNDGNASVSPKGDRIAFSNFKEGKADIYVMNADGTEITQLTSDTLDNRWPRWTPDGKYIAFTRVAGDNSDIWIMKPNGGKQKPFVTSIFRDEILEFRPLK